jgi:predicted dinucleotide-binding enzyme
MSAKEAIPMKMGILGSGDVGRALGTGLAALGHEVKIGSRDPGQETIRNWLKKAGGKASAGTFAEAAAFGELAVLATSWAGTENAIKLAGPTSLAGKVVIDVTNPLDFSGGAPRLAVGHTDSAGEMVQRWLPKSKVVKTLNHVGNAHMVNPQFPGGPPDMFVCGNDAKAKRTVTDLLKTMGWPAIDIGGIEGARYLEPLAMLWIVYGAMTNTWNHAFKLLRK